MTTSYRFRCGWSFYIKTSLWLALSFSTACFWLFHTKVALHNPMFVEHDEYVGIIQFGTKDKAEDSRVENFSTTVPKATIAYAVSLTGCGESDGHGHSELDYVGLYDGSAVLKHSVHLNSFRYNSSRSKYDYKMVVFVHPSAISCSAPFEAIGYEIQVRDTPINVSEIQGEFLKTNVVKSGCCGEKEYIKLYSYTLMEYPLVVHLDMDSVLFQPLDELFDAILDPSTRHAINKPTHIRSPLPSDNTTIQAMFTRDYLMVNVGKKDVGVQGGFFIVRPNTTVFKEYQAIILEGNFIPGIGWAAKYGGYFGAQQIQGLMAYYYDGLYPGQAVELDYCTYNNMGHYPYDTQRRACLGPNCKDCRIVDFATVRLGHFTKCPKPWSCKYQYHKNEVCYQMTREWFRLRRDMDSNFTTCTSINFHLDQFHGCCERQGITGYLALAIDSKT